MMRITNQSFNSTPFGKNVKKKKKKKKKKGH